MRVGLFAPISSPNVPTMRTSLITSMKTTSSSPTTATAQSIPVLFATATVPATILPPSHITQTLLATSTRPYLRISKREGKCVRLADRKGRVSQFRSCRKNTASGYRRRMHLRGAGRRTTNDIVFSLIEVLIFCGIPILISLNTYRYIYCTY